MQVVNQTRYSTFHCFLVQANVGYFGHFMSKFKNFYTFSTFIKRIKRDWLYAFDDPDKIHDLKWRCQYLKHFIREGNFYFHNNES